MSVVSETPVTFRCHDATLVGILAKPEPAKRCAVLIVPGAPQYRAGSHRQYVLLGRALAAAGYPNLRFDYRGIGDSDGEVVGFENIDDDIAAAIDTLFARLDFLDSVVLWGLCDGASAASFYAARGDERIGRMVLVNPWVRSERGLAQAQIRHYYLERITSRSFWRNAFRNGLDLRGSLGQLVSTIGRALPRSERPAEAVQPCPDDTMTVADYCSLPERVGSSLRRFGRPVCVILSEADLTAKEFEQCILKSKKMRDWCNNAQTSIRRLESANHTYSKQIWRDKVHTWSLEWLDGS